MKQIKQELTMLETALEAIATDFNEAYRDYLSHLKESLRRQVVLACYHLCTQGYPERFLDLSYQQRQTLQQAIRNHVRLAQVDLADPVGSIQGDRDDDDNDELAPDGMTADSQSISIPIHEGLQQAVTQAQKEGEQNSPDPAAAVASALESFLNAQSDDEDEDDFPDLQPTSADCPLLILPSSAQQNSQESVTADQTGNAEAEAVPSHLIEARSEDGAAQPWRITPNMIVMQQEHLEESIADILRNLAEAVNASLQKAGIIPRKLPEAVLEAALKADMSAEAVGGPPNMLNLLIETESEEEGSQITRIMAVRLRPAELEFSDTLLAAKRASIRELTAQFHKVGKDYFKKKREWAIAEAESAWRSSWFEDENP